MSFRNHEGLTEMTKFADLYTWAIRNPEKVKCPNCGRKMIQRFYPTFNMNQAGFALFNCTDTKCHFFFNEIRIESTMRD